MHSPLHHGGTACYLWCFAVHFGLQNTWKEDEISNTGNTGHDIFFDFETISNLRFPTGSYNGNDYYRHPWLRHIGEFNLSQRQLGTSNLKHRNCTTVSLRNTWPIGPAQDLALSFLRRADIGAKFRYCFTDSDSQMEQRNIRWDNKPGGLERLGAIFRNDSITLQEPTVCVFGLKALGSTYESSDVMLDRILLEENQ